MSVDTSSALDGAIWMASHGYQIWPCRIRWKPNEKGEFKKDVGGLPKYWESGGLTDPDDIRAQWATTQATGYMIACGPSRITVVDTDIKNGVDGNQNYLNAGGLGANFIVQTWSGGWHRYYQSAGAGNSAGNPPGVDVRGIGGGAFGPGSIVIDQYGNFAGQYTVNAGSPSYPGLSPEPANLAAITKAPKWMPKKTQIAEDGDPLILGQTRYPPMTVSRARQVVANKVDEIRNMKNVPASGMRYRIMGAAMLLTGVMHADLGYDYDMARQALIDACRQAYGDVWAEDEEWIDSGLNDGLEQPIPVYPDPLPPEQADPLGLSGSVAGSSGDDRIVDLSPYLDGTYQPPLPDVGAKRNDGVQMLYSGRWHTVVGLTEAGKSLFAIWQALAVIASGGLVVYLHFEETDVRGTLERLQRFGQEYGLDTDAIRKQFVWMNCETRWNEGDFARAMSKLPQAPTLVVLDGVNAAVAQHGEEVMHPKSVAVYRKLFVSPATVLGAAVLSLGHPVKDRQRQGERHSFGSTAWLDEVDGVAFRLVASSKPIAKGRSGSSALSSVKDRYSEVKRWGVPDPSKEPGWTYLGQFVVDDSPPEGAEPWHPAYRDHGTTAFVAAPKTQTGESEGDGPEDGSTGLLGELSAEERDDIEKSEADNKIVLDLVAGIMATGHAASRNAIEGSATGLSRSRVRDAIERLVLRGQLAEGRGPRNSRVYALTTSPHDQI